MTIQQIDSSSIPYQILDPEGNLVGEMPKLNAERMLSLYRFMQLGRVFSNKRMAVMILVVLAGGRGQLAFLA